MKIDIFKKLENMKNKKIKHTILDKVLNINIPFNRRLKFKITELNPKVVSVTSPSVKSRQNHIKGAHACALATLGEYPAGLVLAQNFSVENYRFILKELSMNYEKQGRGELFATCSVKTLKKPSQTAENWYKMKTEITNKKGELVAICNTNWQVKPWGLVKSKKV